MSVSDTFSTGTPRQAPCAFLCHASEDKPFGRRIAQELQAGGIETFFDEWEIGPGDSIRRTIDDGLERCTHFVAILTPNSLAKSWVNAEMDAGFVRKVEGHAKFIALRHQVSAKDLPPLLRGLHSPSVDDPDRDLPSLISAIHGITTKPPLGPAPSALREARTSETGLSPAAEAIARLFFARSEHGLSEPGIEVEELRAATALPDDDIIDAVDELEARGFVRKTLAVGLGRGPGFASLKPEPALFAALDQHFHEWDPAVDARRLAADLVNEAVGWSVPDIANGYGWPARRMNPALSWLLERELVTVARERSYPWRAAQVCKNGNTRRFVLDNT